VPKMKRFFGKTLCLLSIAIMFDSTNVQFIWVHWSYGLIQIRSMIVRAFDVRPNVVFWEIDKIRIICFDCIPYVPALCNQDELVIINKDRTQRTVKF